MPGPFLARHWDDELLSLARRAGGVTVRPTLLTPRDISISKVIEQHLDQLRLARLLDRERLCWQRTAASTAPAATMLAAIRAPAL